jgi:hypothetical protein
MITITNPKKIKHLVAVTGYARSGKDLFAASVGIRYAFADPIKRIISTTFGFTLEELDFLKNDEKGLGFVYEGSEGHVGKAWHMREVLQRFGTEAMQATFGTNVWADLLVKNIIKELPIHREALALPVVSDLRFLHEYEVLKANCEKLTVVRIERDKAIPKDTENLHRSEAEFMRIPTDIVLNNNTDSIYRYSMDIDECRYSIYKDYIK